MEWTHPMKYTSNARIYKQEQHTKIKQLKCKCISIRKCYFVVFYLLNLCTYRAFYDSNRYFSLANRIKANKTHKDATNTAWYDDGGVICTHQVSVLWKSLNASRRNNVMVSQMEVLFFHSADLHCLVVALVRFLPPTPSSHLLHSL